jgi:tetratricopeptide (TPR) repeat protein
MRTILSLLILAGAACAQGDFVTLVDQGRAALMSFDLESARIAFAQACPAEQLTAMSVAKRAQCEHEFGALEETRGTDNEAGNHYLKALANWEKLGPAYLPHRIATLTNLGGLYRRRHRLSDAEGTLAQALEFARPLANSEPEMYATVLIRSAGLYVDLDQPDRARPMLDEAIAKLDAITPPNAPELAYAWNTLGMLDLMAGQYKSGESGLRKAVALAQGSLGESNPETAAYSTNLALALLVQGQYSRAATLLRRARFVIESRLGPDSVQLVNVLAELTSAEAGMGRFQIAEDCGEKALSIQNRHYAPGGIEIVLTQVNLAGLYLRERKTAEAERILPAAIEAERRFYKDGRTLADGIRDLASLRAQQHSWNEAESLYREAIGLYEHKLGADHPDIAPVLRQYAGVLKRQGVSRTQVRTIEARARAIENASPRPQIS